MRYALTLLFSLLVCGCIAYVPDVAVPGEDVVWVSDGVYYREVVIYGETHRFFYHWHPRNGWVYHNRVIVHVHR